MPAAQKSIDDAPLVNAERRDRKRIACWNLHNHIWESEWYTDRYAKSCKTKSNKSNLFAKEPPTKSYFWKWFQILWVIYYLRFFRASNVWHKLELKPVFMKEAVQGTNTEREKMRNYLTRTTTTITTAAEWVGKQILIVVASSSSPTRTPMIIT